MSIMALWRTKLWLGTLLAVFFCAGYFSVQRHPPREPTTLPLTPVDRAVPFMPMWVWAYQSIYLLMPAAWLAQTRGQLRRYAAGFLGMTLVGFLCFALFPVIGPRPTDAPAEGMFGLLIAYDGALNAFPSLHVAVAVYHARFVERLAEPRIGWGVLLWGWIAMIAFSTLATKQHYFIDLPPGALLGWAADRLAWRRST